MNADELAEKVRETYELYIPKESKYFWIMDAAVMLRQQQAEIEELKSELDRAVENYTDKAIENEALKKQLKIVSTNLRQGISKSIQKAQARAIDETLDDWKRTREYCS